MRRKGYQGPFVNMCDGIMSVTFHGPAVSMDPPWIDSNDNPYQMPVVDCRQFCSDSFLYATGDGAQSIGQSFDISQVDSNRLRESLCDSHTEPCLLGYPGKFCEISDGPLAVARSMEELWNIFLFDGYFYFTRSWTGKLRHRARVEVSKSAMFVTEVATTSHAADSVYSDACVDDRTFGVRQADFLIKTLLYDIPCPAPLPVNAPAESGGIALYALTEYGRIGCYPTFDDTTEYRLCLNGARGRFPTNPDNVPLVNAISAASDHDSQDGRLRLLDELRNRTFFISFRIPDEELQQGAFTDGTLTAGTPFQVARQDWQGQPCYFAYTDAAYRVEPSHGCMAVKGNGLAAFVRQFHQNAGVVINPAGPATCKLDLPELIALADDV